MDEQKQTGLIRQNANKQNDVVEIDLRQLWAVFASRWFIIILIALVCAAATFGICKFLITPKYEAQATILILNTNKEEGSISTSDLSLSSTLSKDFVTIATSDTTLELVNKQVSTEGATIKATIITDTRIIKITVRHEDEAKAIKIADCLASAASERISEIMIIPDMVRIVDKAKSQGVVSPTTTKNTAIAFILGFIVIYIIFAIAFISNDKINTAEDIDKYLGVPVLGIIPLYESRL